MTKKIGVIGSGAWGTALAQAIALSEKPVLLWTKEISVCSEISKKNTNTMFLKDIYLAETIDATTKLEEVVKECDVLFVACPSKFYTEIITLISGYVTEKHKIIICSKGFRESDGALLSDILEEILPVTPSVGVLSGPAFAIELAKGKHCVLTISSKSQELIKEVNQILSLGSLRLYHNDDIIGAQVGATLKNVIAIAAGITYEMKLGESVRAAVICRGMKEVDRYNNALGGQTKSIYGLAGLGDILLTAKSESSRNYIFGRSLGKGFTTEEAFKLAGGIVEGYKTSRIVTMKALSQGIDLAIISAVDGIIYGDITAEKAIEHLMKRPRIHEWD